MGLLNFLYKDEALIASLYAQIYRGRLVEIDREESTTDSENGEIKGGIPLLGAKTAWGSGACQRVRETIDPHDAATLDVLKHLEAFAVSEEEALPNKVVLLSGRLALMSHSQRSCIIDMLFESHIKNIKNAMGLPQKQANRLYDLSKKGCAGKSEEVRLFFQSSSGAWYWGSAVESNFSPHMDALQISYGVDLVPVNIFAIYLGSSCDKYEIDKDGAQFSRALQSMTAMANNALAGEDVSLKSAITPLAIIQPIDAEEA